jgi:hypothetical protein
LNGFSGFYSSSLFHPSCLNYILPRKSRQPSCAWSGERTDLATLTFTGSLGESRVGVAFSLSVMKARVLFKGIFQNYTQIYPQSPRRQWIRILVLFLLCGCGGLRGATCPFGFRVQFWVWRVCLRLLRRGEGGFLHVPCMRSCWVSPLVNVEPCRAHQVPTQIKIS